MSDIVEDFLIRSRTGFDRINNETQLVRWAEESQFARQAIEGNPKFMECTRESLENSIINVAATGLTLNPAHGYAYLIPEYDKQLDKTVCRLRISFKGLIKIAIDSGSIEWVAADVVKEGDVFRFNGKWAKPDHNLDNPFAEEQRGKSIGVYCCVKLRSGDYITELAPWSEVLKAKAAAKTQRVWDSWEDEMAKKFIIKRASKQWPKTEGTERLATAVAVVNEYEGSDALLDKMAQTAAYILDALHDESGPRVEEIVEAWEELTDEEKKTINTAYTKGGYFQHKERTEIKELLGDYYREQRQLAEPVAGDPGASPTPASDPVPGV